MKHVIDTYKKTGALHHAYLVEGDGEMVSEVLDFIEHELEHPVVGNPDFWHERYETFSIDDARKLKEMSATKAISWPRKIFVLQVLGMTSEAQNALLKMFEEPPAHHHFFIVTPSAEIFLPTLRSRLFMVATTAGKQTPARNFSARGVLSVPTDGARVENFSQVFANLSLAKRLTMIAPIIEEKNKVKAQDLLDCVIVEYSKKKDRKADVIKELLTLRSYINDRSPSLKLILEHLAVVI